MKQTINIMKQIPEIIEVQLFDRILLFSKIKEGHQQIKEGKGYTTEEAKRKLKKWLK